MEKRKIEISEFVEEELKTACRYFEENYSTRYAERFRKTFYENIRTILPYPLKYPECRYLPTKRKIYRNIIWEN